MMLQLQLQFNLTYVQNVIIIMSVKVQGSVSVCMPLSVL